nr:immunoglobulin heavy chain junction region [Mus musculus]
CARHERDWGSFDYW